MSDVTLIHDRLPDWVPPCAQRYIAHTEAGCSIRKLARDAGVHASTVLRQVRRVEMRRDDPLIDAALADLARSHQIVGIDNDRGNAAMNCQDDQTGTMPNSATLARESVRVLRRLCESGAVLAVADKMEKAVVVRDVGPNESGPSTAAVDRQIARAMALKDWISCSTPGRISRYRITAAGRAALGQLLASAENDARCANEIGFAESQARFTGPVGADSPSGRRQRYSTSDSPLSALARRRDRDGNPFLAADLVQAGERLREDFELAQIGPRMTQNWDQFLTGGKGSSASGVGDGCLMARDRLARALTFLGQGLSDVALRCCCHLEGLETAEKRMGWSARSGKIVLRIALQRLRHHYHSLSGADRMIG